MEFVCDPKHRERNGSTFHSLCPMDSDALSDLPFHPLSFRVVLCAFRYHGPEGKRRNRCTHSATDFMYISYYRFSKKGIEKQLLDVYAVLSNLCLNLCTATTIPNFSFLIAFIAAQKSMAPFDNHNDDHH